MQKKLLNTLLLPAALLTSAAAYSDTWVPIYMDGITIFVPLQAQVSEVGVEYQYDALGRLIQVKENGTAKINYSYDPAGNRVSVSEAPSN